MTPHIFLFIDPCVYYMLFQPESLFIIMSMVLVLLIRVVYWMINIWKSTLIVPLKFHGFALIIFFKYPIHKRAK